MSEHPEDLPRITVVTPTLNRADTLRQTIESVIQQEYPHLEYIIVDGGSTDRSLDIIADHREHLSHVLVGQDRSMYDAIAKGFDRATGEVLAWLNADDLYEPGVLLRVGRYFAEHPDQAVLYFTDTVWKQGWRVSNRLQRYVGLPELLLGHILYQDGVFFRRAAYEAVGGLEREGPRLAGDYLLWLKLAARYRFTWVPGHGSCFRIRPTQLSGDWSAYRQEMAAVRGGATRYLPRFFWIRSAPGLLARRVASFLRNRSQRLAWPLSDEEKDWSPVQEAPPQPLSACRCPICRQPPQRLLFSSPDTRFGDRTVRQIYFCPECEAAFLFPAPGEKELAALYERTYSGDLPAFGEPAPGTYSPFRVGSWLARRWHYDLLAYAFHLHARLGRRFGFRPIPYDDIVFVHEAPDAPMLEIGCFEGRVLDWLRGLGYRNLYGTDFNTQACQVAAAKGHRVYAGDIRQTSWPGEPMQALVLNQLLEHVGDPVGFLAELKPRLRNGGRVYLSTPNLDSAWIRHYGPAWAHWHFPYHHFIVGPRGLHEIARRAGYRVAWMRSNTPVHWAYMSELLGVRGLGGYVSHNLQSVDKTLWRRAAGATVVSWLRFDRRLRGDCLHACLVTTDAQGSTSPA